jgi:transposase-like protein
MDELEIKIALSYKVPESDLTLNGILRGLQEDQNTLMKTIVRTILSALEERAIQEYRTRQPDRYYRHGHQPRSRKFITSFGPIHYRLAQLLDRQTGNIFPPLAERLSILSYKQYQREALEAAVGQVIHLSYRMAEKEVRRIKGYAPGRSTLHRCVKELAEGYGQWPCYKHRDFKFLMVDGTKVKRQGPRGAPLDQAEMRWALASEEVRRRFEPVGFWVAKDWKFIRQDLEKRLDYGKLEVLFSDGGPGIEFNLLAEGMRSQRCVWHGKRDFAILLYQDGAKKEEQEPFYALMKEILLFSLRKDLLEEVLPPEKELVVELVEDIKQGFDKLIKALDPHKYPKARTYIENFASNALLVFDYWLEGKGWIPMTTNAIESAFSRIVNRVKHVGRRWSDEGLINWLMIAFRKIYKPALWDELWRKYLEIHKQLRFSRLRVSYAWN